MIPFNPNLFSTQNPMLNLLQQFSQFRSTFNGNAEAQVKSMLESGQITQDQYDAAVQKAQQLMQFFPH